MFSYILNSHNLLQMYKTAKKTNNKSWKYFKIFDKHFGNNEILDKYESCKYLYNLPFSYKNLSIVTPYILEEVGMAFNDPV